MLFFLQITKMQNYALVIEQVKVTQSATIMLSRQKYIYYSDSITQLVLLLLFFCFFSHMYI
jgi:hypothetical protein